MIKQLLPKGRQVTLDNAGKIAQIYLEGQEKTHVVDDVLEDGVILKSLHAKSKFRDLYNFDIHHFVPNDTGGYNSRVFSHRYG